VLLNPLGYDRRDLAFCWITLPLQRIPDTRLMSKPTPRHHHKQATWLENVALLDLACKIHMRTTSSTQLERISSHMPATIAPIKRHQEKPECVNKPNYTVYNIAQSIFN
jgi:hypothetical protein